jgi:pimeloyl-ACP methyl ester carboxylesterase
MKKVYFISGLGADRSVYEALDLSFCEPFFLDWIEPLKNESLKDYALRLAKPVTESDATIVGLSLGGMMATEIVKGNPGMKAIIISSNRTSKEFPAYSRFLAKYLPLYRLLNRTILMTIFPIAAWLLGAKTKDQKKLLRGVFERTNIPFIKWSIGAIVRWDHTDVQPNVIHIHGTADKVLPYRNVHADHTINKGEHFMIRNRPQEISVLLRKLCN